MTHTHTNGRSTSVRAKRAPLAATAAAAAAVVVVAMMAGTAHAQGDQSTVFATSTSIALGKEDFVLTDTYAYVDVVGNVNAPGLAVAGAAAGAGNEDGYGYASSDSYAATFFDYPVALSSTGAFAYQEFDAAAYARAYVDPDSDDGDDTSLQNLLGDAVILGVGL